MTSPRRSSEGNPTINMLKNKQKALITAHTLGGSSSGALLCWGVSTDKSDEYDINKEQFGIFGGELNVQNINNKIKQPLCPNAQENVFDIIDNSNNTNKQNFRYHFQNVQQI